MSKITHIQLKKYSYYTFIVSFVILLIGLAVIGSAQERTVRIPAYNMVDVSGTIAQSFQGISLVLIGCSLLFIATWLRIKSFDFQDKL